MVLRKILGVRHIIYCHSLERLSFILRIRILLNISISTGFSNNFHVNKEKTSGLIQGYSF